MNPNPLSLTLAQQRWLKNVIIETLKEICFFAEEQGYPIRGTKEDPS